MAEAAIRTGDAASASEAKAFEPALIRIDAGETPERLRLVLYRNGREVRRDQFDAHDSDAEGRRALNRLMPMVADRAVAFVGHSLLISLAGLHLLFPGSAGQEVDRLGGHIVPRLRKLTGRASAIFWISEVHLVVFLGRGVQVGAERCADECAVIADSLLGEQGYDAIDVYSLESVLDNRLEFLQMPMLTSAEIEARREELASTLGWEFNYDEDLEDDEDPAWEVFRHVVPGAVVDVDSIPESHRFMLPPDSPVRFRTADLPALGLLFQPVWDMPNQVVSTSTALPTRVASGRLLMGLDAVPEARQDAHMLNKLYLQQLAAAADAVRALQLRGKAALVNMNIPFDALSASRMLQKLMKALNEIEPEVRQCLLLALVDIPRGVNRGKIDDILKLAEAHGRGAMLIVDLNGWAWREALEHDAVAVGLDLSLAGRQSGDPCEEVMRFAALARQRKRRTFLGGIRGERTLQLARACQIDFLAGPAVAPMRAEPVPAQFYAWDDHQSGKPLN